MSADNNDDDPEYATYKVVLLGDAGVGKTSIICRYVTNSFSSVLMSTTGATYANKKLIVGNKKIRFEIWDTAGQERYRSLAKMFYQNANVIILVYDITRKSSLNSINDFWIKQIRENARKDVILGLAGNKSDLYENEEVKLNEAKLFAKEIGAIFKTTSAKSSTGIDELFLQIGEKILNPNYNINVSNMNKEEELEYRKMMDKKKLRLEEASKKTKDKVGCC